MGSETWRHCKTLPRWSTGKHSAEGPPLNDFALELAPLFGGMSSRPACLTEHPWTMGELKTAIKRLKRSKNADETGLVAKLFH